MDEREREEIIMRYFEDDKARELYESLIQSEEKANKIPLQGGTEEDDSEPAKKTKKKLDEPLKSVKEAQGLNRGTRLQRILGMNDPQWDDSTMWGNYGNIVLIDLIRDLMAEGLYIDEIEDRIRDDPYYSKKFKKRGISDEDLHTFVVYSFNEVVERGQMGHTTAELEKKEKERDKMRESKLREKQKSHKTFYIEAYADNREADGIPMGEAEIGTYDDLDEIEYKLRHLVRTANAQKDMEATSIDYFLIAYPNEGGLDEEGYSTDAYSGPLVSQREVMDYVRREIFGKKSMLDINDDDVYSRLE
jgi:hypothetical protein